ncbi:GspH/FimT family pseudopilin [Pseudazoarcus pumilus]|uniref:Type II secretion system protein H n=1 Tax=Pseudazoarcus pumilus TaxID=2067960 RepID=A0A2I6S8D4_9RHOO|nr:GspH/FimT family pseudopilin [Pseudazoarcus pumilus]AUN95497.1 hypothetical protein C0099_11505 [Pseudazoarcus pumilus]
MRSFPARPQGLTLIELVVTIAILAIVIALAAPSFAAIVRDNRIATGTNQLMGALQTARSEAVRRGHRVNLCVSQNLLTCVDGDSAAGWDGGWLMFADQDGDNVLDDDEEILQVGNPLRGLQASGNGPVKTSISFAATGQPRQAGTIGLCGGVGEHVGRSIVISVVGRIRHDHVECEASTPASPEPVDPDDFAPYPEEG